MADGDFWRDVISSGATTASTYLTFKHDKLIVAAQDDASAFVASDGAIRGPTWKPHSPACAATTRPCRTAATWSWPTPS